jgi:hypothetical protein
MYFLKMISGRDDGRSLLKGNMQDLWTYRKGTTVMMKQSTGIVEAVRKGFNESGIA